MENRQKLPCAWTKTYEGAESAQNGRQIWKPACLKTPITTFCWTILMEFEFF